MISKITIVNNKMITISFKSNYLIDPAITADSIKNFGIFESVSVIEKEIRIIDQLELSYDKVSELVNLLKTLSLIQSDKDNDLEFITLSDAWKRLKNTGNILCGYKNALNYEIQIPNDSIILLLPINPVYKNSSSDIFKQLIKKIESHKINNSLSGSCINIFSSSKPITDIVKNLLTIFITQNVIDEKDIKDIYNQAMLVFFKKMAKDEIDNLHHISNKSIDHPLSKYQSISKDLENLLSKAINGIPIDLIELSTLKNAITRTGDFTTVPEIITKNLNRLPKDIDNVLSKIVTSH